MTISTYTGVGDEPKPRLGSLLIEHGVLSAAQLQEALVEQQRTGVPLGHVLVQHGYVNPGVVAQALATQRGGIAKTEFGMAVGFETDLGRAAQGLPPVSPTPSPAQGSAPSVEPEGPSFSELQLLARAAEERLDAMAEQMAEAARRIAAAEIDRDQSRTAAAAAAEKATQLEHEVERLSSLLAAIEQRHH